MNTKTTFFKGLGVATIIGLFSVILLSSLASPASVNADSLVSVSISITNSICVGQSAHLTWSSVGATSVSIDQGIGSVSPSGDRYVSPSATTTYTITGTNSSGGYGTASATVVVTGSCPTPTPTPTPAPVQVTANISANPNPICIGQFTFLSWTTSGATQATIAQLGAVGVNSSQMVSPVQTTTYLLNASNTSGGSANASTTVVVTGPCSTPAPIPTPTPAPAPMPIIALFTAAPAVCVGQSIDLVWNTVNASNVAISPNIGSVPLSGDRLINPTQTTIYVLTATNTQGASTTASTTVQVTGPCVTPPPVPTPYPTPYPIPYPTYTPSPILYSYLTISKMVRDISTNTSEVKSVNANANDTVEFVIRVSAPNSQSATNVRVTDSLPYGLTYVVGSTTVNNSYLNDGITSGGINIGSLYAGQLSTIRFRATVSQTYNQYGYNGYNNYNYNNAVTLTNSASVTADNASTVTDSASVMVGTYIAPQLNQQTLTIQKTARDISRGDTTPQTSLTARASDGIEFTIIVTAPYNTSLNNVVISDALPAGMNYTAGSTTLNNNRTNDGIVTGGLNIGTLSSGQQATIVFYATVNPGVGSGQVLVNTASARADNISSATSNPVSITIGNGTVIAGALHVRTGPTGDAFALAGFGGLMSSALYAAKRKGFSLIKLV